ncbi:hypothetical protein M3Y98_01181900 [Aphelenchoides besseyi]|nr:hypothetical protein M3Y98_01181900 [Aphelenchoides besseyi]KAI6211084.1 hypothetical protein M3Y96_00395600 [Aphelenchoides besseyi]
MLLLKRPICSLIFLPLVGVFVFAVIMIILIQLSHFVWISHQIVLELNGNPTDEFWASRRRAPYGQRTYRTDSETIEIGSDSDEVNEAREIIAELIADGLPNRDVFDPNVERSAVVPVEHFEASKSHVRVPKSVVQKRSDWLNSKSSDSESSTGSSTSSIQHFDLPIIVEESYDFVDENQSDGSGERLLIDGEVNGEFKFRPPLSQIVLFV